MEKKRERKKRKLPNKQQTEPVHKSICGEVQEHMNVLYDIKIHSFRLVLNKWGRGSYFIGKHTDTRPKRARFKVLTVTLTVINSRAVSPN